jgi:hypothetical protein
VILLDSDILLIDTRYPNDPRATVSSQCLQQLKADAGDLGITMQVMLEVVGVLSFNTSAGQIPLLPAQITATYNLAVLPDPRNHLDYAGCTFIEGVDQMCRSMALGDAVLAVQIARYANSAQCLLTWNAKHFVGKIVIPVFTPEEWLQQRLGQTP